MTAATTPATPAQLSVLQRAMAAFQERYTALRALNPAKLTAVQRAARDELLSGAARIDASIRAATGIKSSITTTVSGWAKEVGGLFSQVKSAVGLGILPVLPAIGIGIAAVAGVALTGSIISWLRSDAWAKLADTSIKKSVHELATDAYSQALTRGQTPEAAATSAAAVSAALAPPSFGGLDWNKTVQYGLLGGALYLLFRTITEPAPPSPQRSRPRRR